MLTIIGSGAGKKFLVTTNETNTKNQGNASLRYARFFTSNMPLYFSVAKIMEMCMLMVDLMFSF